MKLEHGNWELRLGDCLDPVTGLASLPDGAVTHVISDPPYSERTHAGQAKERFDGSAPTALSYDHLTPADVSLVAPQLSRVAAKWRLIMTSHDLFDSWEAALAGHTFAPLPIVLKGMTVRLQGDGPSSWTVWMVVNRATGLVDGTKPGAYVGPRAVDLPGCEIKGTKPLWLMERIIRDYTKPGDLVCDPFTGSGTTGIAALKLGRRFLGWERVESHHAIAMKRLRAAREQLELCA